MIGAKKGPLNKDDLARVQAKYDQKLAEAAERETEVTRTSNEVGVAEGVSPEEQTVVEGGDDDDLKDDEVKALKEMRSAVLTPYKRKAEVVFKEKSANIKRLEKLVSERSLDIEKLKESNRELTRAITNRDSNIAKLTGSSVYLESCDKDEILDVIDASQELQKR